jgi:hypothetical protein
MLIQGELLMPFGESLGEFILKATSVRTIPLGADQTRTEVDFVGDVKGEVTGRHFGTLLSYPTDLKRPYAWTYNGRTLADSGAVVRVTGEGTAIRSGDGHKIRFRGAQRFLTDDPKLSEFNQAVGAIEAEADPMTMTLTGVSCIWK